MTEIEGIYLTDKPKPWPYLASEARDRAAEEAAHGINLLRPVLEGTDLSEVERLRRIALALCCFNSIARLLESVGAQTRP